MAQITRWAPTYSSRFTVEIRNGSGLLQIGERVAARLAQLDVNLVEGGNASSFNYKETQIIAGSSAATVAADIHAILGHGVILSGRDLPPNTVVVIVGKDIKPKDLQ
jgi:hypothetical protein